MWGMGGIVEKVHYLCVRVFRVEHVCHVCIAGMSVDNIAIGSRISATRR